MSSVNLLNLIKNANKYPIPMRIAASLIREGIGQREIHSYLYKNPDLQGIDSAMINHIHNAHEVILMYNMDLSEIPLP